MHSRPHTLTSSHPHIFTLSFSQLHTLTPSNSHILTPSHLHTLTLSVSPSHTHTLTEDPSQPITLSQAHEHTSQPQTDRVIRLHQLQDHKVSLLSIFVSLACEQGLQRLRILLRSIGLNIGTFVTACHPVTPQFVLSYIDDATVSFYHITCTHTHITVDFYLHYACIHKHMYIHNTLSLTHSTACTDLHTCIIKQLTQALGSVSGSHSGRECTQGWSSLPVSASIYPSTHCR